MKTEIEKCSLLVVFLPLGTVQVTVPPYFWHEANRYNARKVNQSLSERLRHVSSECCFPLESDCNSTIATGAELRKGIWIG